MANGKNGKKKSRKKIIWIAIGGIILLLILKSVVCGKKDPGITVQTEKASKRDITQLVSATGIINPVYLVAITPEVTGEIVELPVKEGERVKKNQLLIRIKPDSYIAQRDRARANLESAQATLGMKKVEKDFIESNYKRTQQLFRDGISNQQELEKIEADLASSIALFERLREDAGRYPDTMDQRYGAWAQLLTLFRLIYDGGQHDKFHVPPRRGYLFDPDRYPFLEGRAKRAGIQPVGVQPLGCLQGQAEAWTPAARQAKAWTPTIPHVSDGVLFRVLSNLLILDGERLSYRTLDVEQIGSVYEAVMGFSLEVAQGRSIAIKPTSSIRVPRRSIDLAGAATTVETLGRHDPCVGIRAVPIAEALLALAAGATFIARSFQDCLALCPQERQIVSIAAHHVRLILDAFRAAGLPIFGPTRAAAQLESSKDYAKAFMTRHRIPTARHRTFADAAEAHAYVEREGAPIVIKADGLAAGKGVVVATTAAEAHAAIDAMLVDNAFADAGARVVIEEFLAGEEASFIVMVDGRHVLALASSQDHKRLKDGDAGPNTGGMGAYSPAPIVTPTIHARVLREIIAPTVQGMAAEGIDYTGAGESRRDFRGKRVVLLDCDLRRPRLHELFGLANNAGVTTAMLSSDGALPVQTTVVPNLSVMTSGPLPPNPAELLGSAKMVTLLGLAAEKFDQVILDGPPVLGLADAPLLGSLAEATVLVVEASGTGREFARNAVKRLRATRTRLIGGILTKMNPRGAAYGYYHSYHYYQYGDAHKRERLPA